MNIDIQHLNTNLKDYTINELFELIELDINKINVNDNINKIINEKINEKIKIFDEIQNEQMKIFFNNIRKHLLPEQDIKNETENEQLLIENNPLYNLNDNKNLKKYYPNQFDRKTITKILTIDSRFRNNYDITTSTRYEVSLQYPLLNVIEMKLSELELPTTYYPINDSYENNYFWIKYIENNITKYAYVYINEGNYYHDNLILDINTFFNTNFIGLNLVYNLNFNNLGGIGVGTGTVTLSATNSTITEFEINFYGKKLTEDVDGDYNSSHIVYDPQIIKNYYNSYSNIDYKQRFGWMIGFRKSYYKNNNTYTSEGVLDLLGPRYFYLILDDQNNSANINFFSNSEKTLINGNVIARLTLKSFIFSIHTQGDFKVFTEPRYYYGPVNIDKMNILLIDEYGREVDLNGMDFSFTLSLITIYSNTN